MNHIGVHVVDCMQLSKIYFHYYILILFLMIKDISDHHFIQLNATNGICILQLITEVHETDNFFEF